MPFSFVCLLLTNEDHELFRLGRRVKLQQETGLEIVTEAEDGESAVEMVKRYPLDVVLLDIELPGIGGIEACRQIKQQNPQLPVLVLTSHSQQPLITRLLEAGAQGYCLKGISAEVLVLAIRSVATGASWWDRRATTKVRAKFEPNDGDKDVKGSSTLPLTPREQEILALIAIGKSNQETAEALYITPGTVKVHVHTILHELGVRDRTSCGCTINSKAMAGYKIMSGHAEEKKISETTLNTSQLKELLKSAIAQILQEQKEVFTDIIIEAIEDIGLAKAIAESENTEPVSREAIFKILSQQS